MLWFDVKAEKLFSPDKPAPSLLQYQYSLLRRTLLLLAVIGIPFFSIQVALYTFYFENTWQEMRWRFFAGLTIVFLISFFFAKNYRSYIPWLVVIFCSLCYGFLGQHQMVSLESSHGLINVISTGTIFLISMLIAVPLMKNSHIILAAFHISMVPFFLLLINDLEHLIGVPLLVRQTISFVFIVILGIHLKNENIERFELQKKLYSASQHDALTGILNRLGLSVAKKSELQRARREKKNIGIAAIDIDHFKDINDQFGHQAGDEILKEVVNICDKTIRPYDVFARVGGEEFIIMLPNCSGRSLYKIAERIRARIQTNKFLIESSKISVTVSIGLTFYSHQDDIEAFETVLKQADQALYQAKETGRNKVVCQFPQADSKVRLVSSKTD